MKKLNLLIITSFSFWSLLQAQTERKTVFGIKGGLNHSRVHGFETNGKKTGYIGTELYGSLFASTRIDATTFFDTGLLFSYTNDYHFIEIPVHIKLMLAKKINLFLGPKLDIVADNLVQNNEGYRFHTFGVSLETGTEFYFTKRLFADFRYSIGLTKQINDLFLDINNAKRNTLRLGAGFRF